MTAPTHQPTGRPPSIALLDAPRVLRRIANGERYAAIAARYGVEASTIGKIAARFGASRPRGRPPKHGSAEVFALRSTGYPAAHIRAVLGLGA